MSPLNRGPLLGPRLPPAGIRLPPPPRFGARLPPPGMPPRMPLPPMSAILGPMRQRLPPPPRLGGVAQPGGPLPLFPPGRAPLPPMAGPRGPLMCPWPRRVLPPQILPHMRPRFSTRNGTVKGKVLNNAKKVIKLEELELKKPWMTDEIRSEIQKKNKLYAKAKKNKDAKEWGEFKDLRNKVTRMIRDAKNEYLVTKHPEQAHLYPNNDEPYDKRDENYESSDEDQQYYCEVCDRDFPSKDTLSEHVNTHKLCGIDGCTFTAHPLLVEKHISMQHSTGLYQRMKNLSTPEDIQKWIAERKRKYPTKANIEEQKNAELKKIQRGEIIKQEQRFVRPRTNKINTCTERKRRNRKRRIPKYENIVPVTDIYRGLISFPGTSCLDNDSNESLNEEHSETKSTTADAIIESTFNISDEEDIPIESNLITSPIKNTLTCSLVADYESEDEMPEEIPIKKSKICLDQKKIMEEKVLNPEQNVNNYNTLSDTVSNKKISNILNKSNRKEKETQPYNIRTKNTVINNKRNNKNSLNLLQRLLSRSIQHERNMICQCIKYIVDNNFFDCD
ncbi:nuclear fragile X mental retardation-interacting protein 1-like [Vespa mandarinia]|uniref:nuclear fragile X mental retardation-interacting protein 1-like n=1 Tax=Vespa mandarinia TaxID=7446 RepID=UPI00161D8AE7|nr:nuclear fragile X mental retardation-interacting protein 1-like [Vespa mandarinia]XP_035724665.1 nuclear fragile X mental retardation-interacting protein 1-like [Vespa mandarinia]